MHGQKWADLSGGFSTERKKNRGADRDVERMMDRERMKALRGAERMDIARGVFWRLCKPSLQT